MNKELSISKDLATKVRFSEDIDHQTRFNDTTIIRELESKFSSTDIAITKELTPSLIELLDKVYKRLGIQQHKIQGFVYASPEIQAECYSMSDEGAIVRFSSQLIELLNDDELSFVVGHEFGHFLLGHSCIKNIGEYPSFEMLMGHRSGEISADRIGLIACQSIDSAVRAMIKTSSGLSSKYLRFDSHAFLKQLNNTSTLQKRYNQMLTHPSMLIRCRALLWFSLNIDLSRLLKTSYQPDTSEIDERIIKDLIKYVDGPARKCIEDEKQNYALWFAAEEIIKDKVFDKNEQSIIQELFGDETLEKLLNFIKSIRIDSIDLVINEKKTQARNALIRILPNRAEDEINEIEKNIVLRFR